MVEYHAIVELHYPIVELYHPILELYNPVIVELHYPIVELYHPIVELFKYHLILLRISLFWYISLELKISAILNLNIQGLKNLPLTI